MECFGASIAECGRQVVVLAGSLPLLATGVPP